MLMPTRWTIEYKNHAGRWCEVTSLSSPDATDPYERKLVDGWAKQASVYYRYVRIVTQVGDDKYGTKEYL